MNTFLSITLLAAILTLAWVLQSNATKFLKAFKNTDSSVVQNEGHGNRVRATRNHTEK
jgi:hypothetical protein